MRKEKLAAATFLSGHAETLRCKGPIVEAGDSRLSVRRHGRESVLQDGYYALVYHSPGFRPVPEPLDSTVVRWFMVDEWLYDHGPGSLIATMRLRAGMVLLIVDAAPPVVPGPCEATQSSAAAPAMHRGGQVPGGTKKQGSCRPGHASAAGAVARG